MDPGASDHSAEVELDPVRSAPRAREADLGLGGTILVESELPEAEIRFYGSTNARPTTPRGGCDGGKADLHAARTLFQAETFAVSALMYGFRFMAPCAVVGHILTYSARYCVNPGSFCFK